VKIDRRFGTLDLVEDKVIPFPLDLFGFPDSKRYYPSWAQKGSPLSWFQSVDNVHCLCPD